MPERPPTMSLMLAKMSLNTLAPRMASPDTTPQYLVIACPSTLGVVETIMGPPGIQMNNGSLLDFDATGWRKVSSALHRAFRIILKQLMYRIDAMPRRMLLRHRRQPAILLVATTNEDADAHRW